MDIKKKPQRAGSLRSYAFRSGVSLAVCALLLFAGGCTETRIIRVSDRAEELFPDFLKEMKSVRAVFVGELHNEARHHRMQLEVIRALKEAGVKVAVGLEMFQADSQGDLDQWVSGDMSEDDFIMVYGRDWKTSWSNYRDILVYARENRIPLVGLNIPREIIHQVFERGFKSLTPGQIGLLPGVRCEVDETYREFIRKSIAEHEFKEDSFNNFCEAQMVWDTTMASRVINYLERNPRSIMVVLAGSGHAWKRGIPEQISRRSKLKYLVVLPEVPNRVDIENITARDADFLWIGR